MYATGQDGQIMDKLVGDWMFILALICFVLANDWFVERE